jgi:hypothetical protein
MAHRRHPSPISVLVALAAVSLGTAHEARAATTENALAASDGGRSAVVIASSLAFGLAGTGTALLYANGWMNAQHGCGDMASGGSGGCGQAGWTAAGPLLAYASVVTFTPSIPRFYMGDIKGGLLFTSVRGVAVATAIFAGGSKNDAVAAYAVGGLGVLLPIIVGVIDLATTPQAAAPPPPHVGLRSVSAAPVMDGHRAHGALFSVEAAF